MKKLFIGFGVLTLAAMLIFNLNLVSSDKVLTFSLKNLLNLACAECEYDPVEECETWCSEWDYHECVLYACDDKIICYHQYWP
jgi:hypothetical protein